MAASSSRQRHQTARCDICGNASSDSRQPILEHSRIAISLAPSTVGLARRMSTCNPCCCLSGVLVHEAPVSRRVRKSGFSSNVSCIRSWRLASARLAHSRRSISSSSLTSLARNLSREYLTGARPDARPDAHRARRHGISFGIRDVSAERTAIGDCTSTTGRCRAITRIPRLCFCTLQCAFEDGAECETRPEGSEASGPGRAGLGRIRAATDRDGSDGRCCRRFADRFEKIKQYYVWREQVRFDLVRVLGAGSLCGIWCWPSASSSAAGCRP